MSKIIAVYGSLKKGKYNHMPERMRHIGESTMTGSMFLCGSYPHLYPEERSMKEQVAIYPVELYEVDDETFSRIDNMENWAGYTGKVLSFDIKNQSKEKVTQSATIWFKDGHGGDSNLPYIEEY